MVDESRSYVPAEESLPELTIKALLLGVALAALLGAANAYLGFKAGQTVSATFPAAVLAIAAFRLPFFRGTVLEQNTMRTAASVGEALAAGAIFTVPAFVMVDVGGERLWTKFNYWETSLILLVGGLLGILFIILLRRTLTVDAQLPFPESRACAQIVITGQKGDTGARYVFGAMGLGMLIQVFKDPAGIPLFQESVRFLKEFPVSVVHHMSSNRTPLGDVTHRGALVIATPSISPALIGVGYIIGFELSAINFAGGVLAWLVFVPLALFLNPGLAAQLSGPGGAAPLPEVVFSIWYNQIRPIAVGAMLVGAMRTLWGMRASIAQAFRGALHRGSAAEPLRTDKDLPARGILVAIAALTLPVVLLYHYFTHSWTGAIVAAVVMMATGFLFSAVGGYLVGLVGSSNQPVSGLALSTLIIAALLMLGFGVRGLSGVGAVLGVAAVVCCACCVAGSLIQDLKVGQILGGTPWKMEVAEIVATVVTSFVLVFPIVLLHEGNIRLGGIGIGDPKLPAPQAGLMAQMAQGIVGGEMPWALILFGMAFAFALVLIKAPSPMLVAVGMYLPPETTAAIFLGGCLKGLVDWRARRAGLEGDAAARVDSTGSLVAAGLIAGESLTGVVLAGLVLTSTQFSSIAAMLGLSAPSYLDGPFGAGLALVPLAALAWLLVRVPLRHAVEAGGSSRVS
jgi:putative OPT family oligopeptide transporter